MKHNKKYYRDYIVFLMIFVFSMPILFVSGGFARIIRYYKYVVNVVNRKQIDTYKY